jgi:hypothetical protein
MQRVRSAGVAHVDSWVDSATAPACEESITPLALRLAQLKGGPLSTHTGRRRRSRTLVEW